MLVAILNEQISQALAVAVGLQAYQGDGDDLDPNIVAMLDALIDILSRDSYALLYERQPSIPRAAAAVAA